MPYYMSDGLSLHYHEHGEGEPLILLHGFAQDSTAWVDPLDHYARFFRVILMDMRGCGLSDLPKQHYGPREVAGDVIALIDHLGADKVHFSGFSLGGAVGLELGIGHASRLKSLSLHSTWAGGPCPHMERWIEIRRRIIAAGDPVVNIGTRIVSFFSSEFVDANEERVEAFIARSRSNPHPISVEGAAGHADACMMHDVRERVSVISTPTLITVGTMDRVTLPSQSEFLHARIAGSEFHPINGAAHFTPYECPGEFVSVSLGFLLKHAASVPSARSSEARDEVGAQSRNWP